MALLVCGSYMVSAGISIRCCVVSWTVSFWSGKFYAGSFVLTMVYLWLIVASFVPFRVFSPKAFVFATDLQWWFHHGS